MRSICCSLALLILGGVLADAEPRGRAVVRSTSDLASLSNEMLSKFLPFDLTGTVLYVDRIGDNLGAFVLDDGHVGAFLHGKKLVFKAGDVLHVMGHTLLSDCGERQYMVDSAERIGTTELPTPVQARLDFAATHTFDYRRIGIRARVHDVFIDEIDSDYVYFILADALGFAYAACRSSDFRQMGLKDLIGADVEITGVCLPGLVGRRRFMGSILRLDNADPIRIVRPAVQNPYEFPELESLRYVSPQTVLGQGQRRIRGKVLAVWNGNSLILESADRTLHRVSLRQGQTLPACGDTVTVGGECKTDFYLVNLDKAICVVERHSGSAPSPGAPIRPKDIVTCRGNRQFNVEYYGKTVRIKGRVTAPNSVINDSRCLYLDCQTHIIPVNISALADFVPPLKDSVVEATGLCLMDVENWRPDNPAPAIRGVSVVARTSADIVVAEKPPFWTPARAFSVLSVTFAVLLGFAVWNVMLNRLVRIRSQELRASQINEERAEIKSEERTRLAVELHDSLSQNLAGIACQLSATSDAMKRCPEMLAESLATARRMLDSSRTELKRCLFDLRGDALETEDFESAIRKTLAPYLDQSDISVKFHIHRSKLDESLAHTTLCIIRELVANAIRHGKAGEIRIAGSLDGCNLLFSVCDDGTGFDPDERPGPSEGHFGIEGIGERIKRYDGTLDFVTSPGNGTKVRISLVIPFAPNGGLAT